jgi:outer membrane protein assembly factor BamB
MYRDSSEEDRSILVAAFNGKVFGIDRATGQVRWKFTGLTHGVIELAVGLGVVVACGMQELAFIEMASGRSLRMVHLVGEYASRPIMLIDGPHIFVARGGEIGCYTTGGDWLWSQPFTGEGLGRMSLALPGNARQADQG